MKNFKLLIALGFGLVSGAKAQVGINTQTPQAALDVNGTVRVTDLPVENTSEISLTGITGGEYLNLSNLGENMVFVNNEVIISPITRIMGEIDLHAQTPNSISPGFITGGIDYRTINNLDPFFGLTEDNGLATFVSFINYNNCDYAINGIVGGTEGRKVTFYFSDASRVGRFYSESTSADPENRIITPNNTPFFGVNGTGFIELVYDADAGSDEKGRWLLLKFQD